MTDQEWCRAWEIFESLSQIPAPDRPGFVRQATTDPHIQTRVLELLAEADFHQDHPLPHEREPEPRVPASIGKYRILSLLGKGGSGEVYAGHDPELDRKVALKRLTPDLYGDGQTELNRLRREARAASTLNHPNIVTVYEVIQSGDGQVAVVTEMVEGKALRELCGSPVPVGQLLHWGHQTASALEAAHRAGIIHRDIKPENIMVRSDGLVKLLDFGLAERLNLDDLLVLPGVPEGTLRYMSPEQAHGSSLTPATDVFSLGLVLYELATGVHPFTADYPLETLYRIGSAAPLPPSQLNPEVPRPLQSLLLRMLEKQPERRPAAAEVATALAEMRGQLERASSGNKVHRRRYWALAVGTSLLLAIVWIADAGRRSLQEAAPARTVRLTSFEGSELNPAISPDGSRVAFTWDGGGSGNYDVYVQPVSGAVDSVPPLRLTTDPDHDLRPAWSPDGEQIALIRLGQESKAVYVASASGGAARKILTINGTAPVWRPDPSQIQFYPGPIWSADSSAIVVANHDDEGDGIYEYSVDGARKRRLTTFSAASVIDSPALSRDRRLAFVRVAGIGIGDIFLQEQGREPRQLTHLRTMITGLTWGHDDRSLLFVGQIQTVKGLWQIPVSGGKPVLLAGTAGSTASTISCSRDGKRIVFSERNDDRNIWVTDRDPRTGKFSLSRKLIASSQQEHSPSFSPDGKSIAFVSDRSGSEEIWICGRDGRGAHRLTSFGHGFTGTPRWSADGGRIVFDARPGKHSAIYVISASGGVPRRLTDANAEEMMPSWSHDGRWIYFVSRRGGTEEIWKIPSEGGTPLQITHHVGREALESPDGRTLYYHGGPQRGICQVPVNGGEETQVPELTGMPPSRYWTVTNRGIFFAPLSTGSREFRFFDFTTRQIRSVMTIEKAPAFGTPSLAVSPDHGTILHAQVDQSGSDIMMIERR